MEYPFTTKQIDRLHGGGVWSCDDQLMVWYSSFMHPNPIKSPLLHIWYPNSPVKDGICLHAYVNLEIKLYIYWAENLPSSENSKP